MASHNLCVLAKVCKQLQIQIFKEWYAYHFPTPNEESTVAEYGCNIGKLLITMLGMINSVRVSKHYWRGSIGSAGLVFCFSWADCFKQKVIPCIIWHVIIYDTFPQLWSLIQCIRNSNQTIGIEIDDWCWIRSIPIDRGGSCSPINK